MLKNTLLVVLILFMTGCAGTIRIAEEDVKGSTLPSKNIMVKPSN